MKFFRSLLAAILGFLIGAFILFIFLYLMIVIIGVVAASGSKEKIKENTVLRLKLNQPIVDRATDNPFEDLNFITMESEKKLGLNEILRNIEKAKEDENIDGIFLNVTYIASNFGGWSTIKEIRDKLSEFKKSEKYIYAYSSYGFSEGAYYLASIADSIFLNPETRFYLDGLGGNAVFFTKTAKELGIEPQVIRVGKYKAAVESFMLEKMSPENREQTMRYVSSIWEQMVGGITETRGISREELMDIVNSTPILTPQLAQEKKLIDGFKYEDEIIEMFRKKTKVKDDKKPKIICLSKYNNVAWPKKCKKAKEKIAVVYASGSIGSGKDPLSIGPELAKTLRKVREDDKIKAVVFRINSPGGSALVSDLIWREVDLLSQEKPVIASMGNVAASGGYYIACAADTIVASPNTITGSIGVFGLFFSGKEFYEQKMKLSFDELKTNEHANFMGGNPLGLPLTSRPINDSEKKILQQYVDDIYETFVSHVAEGRGLDKEFVKENGQGRVWIGEDALELGLVDVMGGLETAIDIAKEKIGVDICKIVEYPIQKDPFIEFMERFSGKITDKIIKEKFGEQYKYYNAVNEALEMQGVQARLPYEIEIQ